MRLDRFTERSQEALQAAQQAAQTLQHAMVEPEHLLLALLEQPEGLAPTLLRRLEAQPETLSARLRASLEARPKQYGGGEPGIGQSLRAVLMAAFDEMNRLKDEYVSTEHLLLALAAQQQREAARLLQQAGVTRDRIYGVLEAARTAVAARIETVPGPPPGRGQRSRYRWVKEIAVARRRPPTRPSSPSGCGLPCFAVMRLREAC
jgi:ATP-dependent Clp protease ATP-binding subunit ClpB